MTRNQNGMTKTNVVDQGSKKRIYDELAKNIVDEIRDETGFVFAWKDLSKLQKDNLMTAFYGSKESARIDRISEGLTKLLSDVDFKHASNILVVDRGTVKSTNAAIGKVIYKLKQDKPEGYKNTVKELEQLKTDIKFSVKNGTRLEDDLLDLSLIDDPEAMKVIESLMSSDSGLVGNDLIRKIAGKLTKELSRQFPTYRTYFDVQASAAKKFLTLANQHSSKPVTTIPIRDWTGKEVDVDFTKRSKHKLEYIDTDGVHVNTEYSVTEYGVPDPSKAASGYPVKFIFAQDSALARTLTTEFPDFDSIFDAWYGPAGQIPALRERARVLMTDMYSADVIKDNLDAMRSRLATYSDEFPEILDEWDLFAEAALNDFDIADVDQSFIDLILNSDEWYGVSY
jgi:hypothetical protein